MDMNTWCALAHPLPRTPPLSPTAHRKSRPPLRHNRSCAYFCTGMSTFGVCALLFMYGILTSGGEWFLGVPEEDAPAAANACLVAALIYFLYLVYCGLKIGKTSAPTGSKPLDEED